MNATSLLEPLSRRGAVVPPDLAATVVLVVLAWSAVLLPVVSETPLRLVFAPLLVLFLPGYALLAALFPGVDGPLSTNTASATNRLDGLDRLLLAVATSIALTVLVGMVLSVTAWGFTTVATTLALGLLAVVCSLVAAVRRGRLSSTGRFSADGSAVVATARAALVTAPLRTRLLNVLIVCGVVLAAGSIGYAAANPHPTEPFSEFYLLSEAPGGPTTQGYDLVPGTNETFRVGVVNHEGRTVDYTVVVVAQQVAVEGGAERVVAQTELDRVAFPVAADGTREFEHTISAETDLDESQRVAYLLYTRPPPAFPGVDTAYRHLFVTVDR
jgi:uncharacterized membrane protein